MRSLFLVAGFFVVVGCSGAPPDAADDAQAIVGGQNDDRDPAVVAINIEATGMAVCSGTLIAPRVVLTAGHCPTTAIWIRQGADVRSPGWFDHVDVAATAKHPQYSGEGKPYDLALVHLGSDLAGVAPIPLSDAPLADVDVGVNVRHVGFGTTGDDLHYVEQIGTGGVKREVTYPITKVDDDFLYSGAPGKQTCIFDSGGPAFRNVDGVDKLIGVVSDGNDCHSDGWDTRVDRPDVLSWIDEELANWGTHR